MDAPSRASTDETVARDERTIAYFDEQTPEYSVERLAPAAEFIREHADARSSLIDVGCGTGNALEYLQRRTGIRSVAGLDVSGECLTKVRKRLGCPTYHGSILDLSLVEEVGPQFDFAVVSAVLHHLIGRSRRQSRDHAVLAIAHAKRLLRSGGYLIVHEPAFAPGSAMGALFYVKKGVSRATKRRVPVFGYWNNIGAPVVSYYTNEELLEMLDAGERGTLVHEHVERNPLPRVLQAVVKRTSTTLIVRKA